jgi:hypothetical protein
VQEVEAFAPTSAAGLHDRDDTGIAATKLTLAVAELLL